MHHPAFARGLRRPHRFRDRYRRERTSIGSPSAEALACRSLTTALVNALLGLTSATKRLAPGASSRNIPSRFATSSTVWKLTPGALPPGRLRLATRPIATGSVPIAKTIGMVVVAALAASD